MMEGAGRLLYGFLVLDPIHVHKKDIAIPISHRIRQQRLNLEQKLPSVVPLAGHLSATLDLFIQGTCCWPFDTLKVS